ncbi:MAG: thiamine-phosphate kinase [Acidobacteriota bacterium]|nr:thiamine-phosphate kinase [Acidobacteriota bacterium]
MASTQTIADLDERALIARIHARVPHTHPDLIAGIGDDAAIIRPARNRAEVITTDALVEDIHFRRAWSSPRDIGAKAMAVNLSDLGAMGAEARFATISLALPAGLLLDDFDELIEGIAGAARASDVVIAGGNLTRSPGPLVIDITAMGAVHARKALRRAAARVNDEVYVTGTIGAGAAGLAWLERHGVPEEHHAAWPAVRRACRPSPPLRAGLALSRSRASRAAIDLSDGLSDGLLRLSEASECAIAVDAAALPVDPSARAIAAELGLDPMRLAIDGGDDYELLFTVSPRHRGRLRGVAALLRAPITRIGVVRSGAGVSIDGSGPPGTGFDHFRRA